MGYNTKNYTEQSGEVTVIGGTLDINGTADFTGATLTGFPEAGASKEGTVKMAANQADSTATEVAGLVTDFNALLAKLKTAGIMVADG